MRDRYDELYRAFRWQVPERFNIAEACCRRHARGSPPLLPLLGGRVGRELGVDLLGPPAAGEPARECPRRARGEARRPRRHHPSPAPRDRDRARRVLPDGRRGDAAVDPVRAGSARVPAAKQRDERRVRRPGFAPQPAADPHRLPDLQHVVGVAGALEVGVTPWEACSNRRPGGSRRSTRPRRTRPS